MRLRPRSGLALVVVSAVGLVAFCWPLLVEPGSGLDGSATAPWLFVALLPLLLAVVLAEVADGGMDVKAVAMLGVLAAVGAALRPLGGGAAGFEPVFFLLVLAGRALGPGFGFVLGAVTLFASALLTAGVGPWLPFQMLAAGWVGFLAGCLPPARGRAEVVLLAAYGAVAGLLYGLLMNLQLWPFATGLESGLSYVAGDPLGENLRPLPGVHAGHLDGLRHPPCRDDGCPGGRDGPPGAARAAPGGPQGGVRRGRGVRRRRAAPGRHRPADGRPSGPSRSCAAVLAAITRADEAARTAAREHRAAHPRSLGRLDDLGVWLAGVQGAAPARPLERVRMLLVAGDHGVADAEVSHRPTGSTATLLRDTVAGTSAPAVVARTVGADVRALLALRRRRARRPARRRDGARGPARDRPGRPRGRDDRGAGRRRRPGRDRRRGRGGRLRCRPARRWPMSAAARGSPRRR